MAEAVPGTAPADLHAADTVALSQVVNAAPPLEPGTRFGQYRIGPLLGEGGMGQVYEAMQGTLERRVALKVMRPELASDPAFSERFLREARAAASVCHQHVVVIFDAGTCDGRLYMAFQHIAGGDLAAALAGCGRYEAVPALTLIAGCCDGLQAIHEAGLVHRDIKPQNILLDAKGRPALGDFGLARQARGDDRMTLTGVGMGTPAYMAPEQAQGRADIDIRADVHALGGTLFTLLTGKPPFTGLTPWMVANSVCNDPAPDPRAVVPELPEPVAALVLRCLAKRREERYQTPAELRADVLRVRAALNGERAADTALPLPAVPAGGPHPFLRWGWLAALATAAVLALLPLALTPLLTVNHRYDPLTWRDAAWWSGWLAASLANAALLCAVLAPRRRDRWILAIPWLGTALGAGLGTTLLAVAACTALDLRAAGWGTAGIVSGWVAGLAWAGWSAPRWWFTDDTLPARDLGRLLPALCGALLLVLICHLAAADGSGSSLSWLEARRGEGQLRGTAAATALAVLAPLTVLLVAPTLVARRRKQ